MLSWISANSGDIIVLLVLGLVVGAVIAAMIRMLQLRRQRQLCIL